MKGCNCCWDPCIAARLIVQVPSAVSRSLLLVLVVVFVAFTASNQPTIATAALFVSTTVSSKKPNRNLIYHCRRWENCIRKSHVWDVRAIANAEFSSDDDDAFLLENEYERSEKRVVKRGELEERLMANSPTSPLLANEPSIPAIGIVKQQGFGGATTSNKKRKKGSQKRETPQGLLLTQPEAAKNHANVLKNEGLVRIDRVLSDSVTDALRDFVYDIRMVEGNKLRKATTTLQDKFPTIRRWDVSIPLMEYDNKGTATTTTTIAYQALEEVFQTTAVGETIHRFLGTDTAELYELASYISDPGSSRQVIHSDTPCFGTNDNQPILCTCFIALQDVRIDMGPTIWLPRTNKHAIHDLYFQEDENASNNRNDGDDNGEQLPSWSDQFLQTQPSVVGLLPKGSCVLFDSRLLHCGTSNKSKKDSRALFFFSFKHPNITLSNPGGDTASIRSDLKGRFRLSHFLSMSPRMQRGSQKPPHD